jgi:cell wall-associated NlpC family hydrolase
MSMANRAVSIARKWVGTPFQEGGSVMGVGTDCAGLIEGIGRDLGIAFPNRAEVDADIARASLSCLIQLDAPVVGGIILLAARPGGTPVHAAIVTDRATLIHAHWRAGVVENRFGAWFKARLTHCFIWPDDASQQDI